MYIINYIGRNFLENEFHCWRQGVHDDFQKFPHLLCLLSHSQKMPVLPRDHGLPESRNFGSSSCLPECFVKYRAGSCYSRTTQYCLLNDRFATWTWTCSLRRILSILQWKVTKGQTGRVGRGKNIKHSLREVRRNISFPSDAMWSLIPEEFTR